MASNAPDGKPEANSSGVGGADDNEKSDDSGGGLERWRIPHAVPLGSIFVWVLEGFIMSGILLGLVLVAQQVNLAGASQYSLSQAVNVVDIVFSVSMLTAFLATIVIHVTVANAFNSPGHVETAGGMHSAASNALCTLCTLCCFTYLCLYVDACVLKAPSEYACSALFRTTPLPEIVVGIVVVYLCIIFLTTVALAFVSCPQTNKKIVPSYLFISKVNSLMASTVFAWASPLAASVAVTGSQAGWCPSR